MGSVIHTKVGDWKGKKRIWLQGQSLARKGIQIADAYECTVAPDGESLRIVLSDSGTYTVSRKKSGKHLLPVMDLTFGPIQKLFRAGESVRAKVRTRGNKRTITIRRLEVADAKARREQRFIKRIGTGEPLRTISPFHGGGILDSAVHDGFKRNGIVTRIGVAVEKERAYLDSSIRNNSHLFDDQSITVNAPIEELTTQPNAFEADLFIAGIPCVGASRSGRAKNGAGHAEDHDEAGMLFFQSLQFIQHFNPAIVIIENVKEYLTTASFTVIQSVLKALGYNQNVRVFNGNEFGAIEGRERMCLVATSVGLPQIDLSNVVPLFDKQNTVSEILEDIALDDAVWKSYSYLDEKAKRDAKKGNNFKRQLVSPSDSSFGTVGRHYNKGRSTEPFIIHPQDSSLSRKLTVGEHAAAKRIPLRLIQGLSTTIAHEVMGQSVIYSVFEAIGAYLSAELLKPDALQQPMAA